MSFGKRTYISPSQIKMLMDCPTKWWFAYVKRPPVKKSAYLPFGGAYHEALEIYFRAKLKGDDAELAFDRVEDNFRRIFKAKLKRGNYSFVGTLDELGFRDRGGRLLSLYLGKMGRLRPSMVEKKFNIPAGAFDIKGVIDLAIVEDRGYGDKNVVVDHKTSNSGWLGNKAPSHGWLDNVATHWAKPSDRASQEVQSYAYPWAYWQLTGEIPDRFEFHVVSPQGLEVHRVRRTKKELEWFERLAAAYFKMAQGDMFPPRDNWWGCNSQWCDYWKYCKGKYQKTRTDF